MRPNQGFTCSSCPASLESLRQVTKTMTLFLAEWCGVEPV